MIEIKIQLTSGMNSVLSEKSVDLESVQMADLSKHILDEIKWFVIVKKCETLDKENHDVTTGK